MSAWLLAHPGWALGLVSGGASMGVVVGAWFAATRTDAVTQAADDRGQERAIRTRMALVQQAERDKATMRAAMARQGRVSANMPATDDEHESLGIG